MKQTKITSSDKKKLKSEYDRGYYAKNREKRLAYHAKWRAINDEKLRAQRRSDPTAKRAYNAAYHAANAEEIGAKRRARYAANPKKYILMQRKYSGTPKKKAYMSKWRSENKDKIDRQRREYVKRPASRRRKILSEMERRAKKHRSEILATKNEVDAFMAGRSVCIYCGRESAKLTLDHFMPLSLGGGHVLENFAAACQSCNSRKKDKHPEDFLIEIGLN